MTDIVLALIVRARKILLCERSPGRKFYPGTWSFPGGHVETGETLRAALVREIDEELSITATDFAFFTSLQDPVSHPVTYHLFEVTGWRGTPTLTGDEHVEMAWFTAGQARRVDGLALREFLPVFAQLRQVGRL